jgi:hypothetical protein
MTCTQWNRQSRLIALTLGIALVCPLATFGQESSSNERANNQASQRSTQGSPSDSAGTEARQDDTAAAERDSDETARDEESKDKGQDAKRQLKIVTLKHRRPQDVRQLLTTWFESPTNNPYASSTATTVAANRGYRGNLADRVTEDVVIATEEDSKLLFIRGSQKEIERVQKLIDAIDVPASEMKEQTIGSTYMIPFKQDRAHDVQTILVDLQLDTRSMALEDLHLILVHHGESEESKQNLKQVKQVLSQLKKNSDKPRGESETQSSESSSESSEESATTGNADR